jgi:hypothetical protein
VAALFFLITKRANMPFARFLLVEGRPTLGRMWATIKNNLVAVVGLQTRDGAIAGLETDNGDNFYFPPFYGGNKRGVTFSFLPAE